MVLHVPDIDNPGERDAVETLLAMRNSSRINRHNEGSNSSEDDPIYSPYLRASPVRGQRFLRGHEASSSFPEYPRMGRSSKLARVREFYFPPIKHRTFLKISTSKHRLSTLSDRD